MVTSSDRIPGTEIFRRSLAERLDGIIGNTVEAASAILVVAEIVILFCGILARYVFHRPLVWSDELASLLFVWLAMLGSVLAFRANEHMRMTALVAKAPPAARRFLEMIALHSAQVFLLVILLPSIAYVQDEAIVVNWASSNENGVGASGQINRSGSRAAGARLRFSISARSAAWLWNQVAGSSITSGKLPWMPFSSSPPI